MTINIIKFFKIKIVFCIVLVLAIFPIKACVAENTYSQQIVSLEQQAEENTLTINHYKDIQIALHDLAQIMRSHDSSDEEFIKKLSSKWMHYKKEIEILETENQDILEKINDIREKTNALKFVGYFTITHYDICYSCCGKTPSHPTYGKTATGTYATPDRTIAVDPKVIPYGTEVIIYGQTYVAEDSGSNIKGNRIDVCVASHSEALQKGRLYNVPVYIKGE